MSDAAKPVRPGIVLATLAAAQVDAAAHLDGPLAERVAALGRDLEAALRDELGPTEPPDPRFGPVGATVTQTLVVQQDDTAAAMGHPDSAMAVLGSPRIALWFEMATSPLMPADFGHTGHAGVGILVHHVGKAVVGEAVELRSTLVSAAGRHGVFACEATVGDRLVATGTHHRMLIERRPQPH